MEKTLSQSQIDDLLNSFSSGKVDIEEVKEEDIGKKAKIYDFRTPKRFTKEQLRVVTSVYENYARVLSSYFTSVLRLYCHIEFSSIEEERYHEFNNALPDTVMMCISDMEAISNNNNMVLLDIPKQLSFAIIERLLGGTGDPGIVERDFTEIEMNIMESNFTRMLSMMNDAWAPHFDVKSKFRALETNSRLIQGLAPDETVVIIIMEFQIKDSKGTLSICIPAECLEVIIEKVNAQYIRNLNRGSTANDEERREMVMAYLKESPLEMRAVIGSVQVTLRDIANLNIGDVLQLNKPMESLIDINIGHSTWFRGSMGIKKNKKAVQIKELL